MVMAQNVCFIDTMTMTQHRLLHAVPCVCVFPPESPSHINCHGAPLCNPYLALPPCVGSQDYVWLRDPQGISRLLSQDGVEQLCMSRMPLLYLRSKLMMLKMMLDVGVRVPLWDASKLPMTCQRLSAPRKGNIGHWQIFISWVVVTIVIHSEVSARKEWDKTRQNWGQECITLLLSYLLLDSFPSASLAVVK